MIVVSLNIKSVELEQDPVYERLLLMKKRYENINHILQDQKLVDFVLILNEDELSFSESLLIKKSMDDLNFKINRVIINKSTETDNGFYSKIKEIFPASIIQLNSNYVKQIISFENLNSYCDKFKIV